MKLFNPSIFSTLFLVCTLTFVGCKSSEKTASIRMTPENTYKDGLLAVDGQADDVYAYQRPVQFALENTSTHLLSIASTYHLKIEQKTEEGWKRVKYTPCLCGSPCQPQGEKQLNPGQKLLIKWDQKESWCEDNDKNPLPDTKSVQVEKGLYRMIFRYTKADTKTRENSRLLEYEFLIQ